MRKRNASSNVKKFFANRWIYGITLAILPSIFDRLFSMKTPGMNNKIFQGFKNFFAIRFTVKIPIWILLSLGLIALFILVRRIVFKKK
jgi:hypothetical protein